MQTDDKKSGEGGDSGDKYGEESGEATGDCADSSSQCMKWATMGECDKNPYWMKPNCQKSCSSCGMTVDKVNQPPVKDGRFCGNVEGGGQRGFAEKCNRRKLDRYAEVCQVIRNSKKW